MIRTAENAVCVIIAARNAADTITRAIRSALNEPAVAEIIVVDDASNDDTAAVSAAADDGTGRLRVLRLTTSRGPAFARNHAIAHSAAPLISILDADDFFLPGRFDILLKGNDWDLVADNILFLESGDDEPNVPDFAPEPRFLDLPAFVLGNISRRGAERTEIGFLKPVMRRAFLDHYALRYNEDLLLGEDYELYVRALAKGARYKVLRTCGYGACVRPTSLSGRHGTNDLERLWRADEQLLALPGLSQAAVGALRRHARHIRARYELRRFLDLKACSGLVSATFDSLAQRPLALPAILAGIAADKLEALRRRSGRRYGTVPHGTTRSLLPGRTVAQESG